MQSYEIPRNYRGESRILYIFSKKALIYTCIGAAIGLIFLFIFRMIGMTIVGAIITAILAVLGFCIGTMKVPEIKFLDVTSKTSGQNIDDVIIRWLKFKKNGNKIYIYKPEEEIKDGK